MSNTILRAAITILAGAIVLSGCEAQSDSGRSNTTQQVPVSMRSLKDVMSQLPDGVSVVGLSVNEKNERLIKVNIRPTNSAKVAAEAYMRVLGSDTPLRRHLVGTKEGAVLDELTTNRTGENIILQGVTVVGAADQVDSFRTRMKSETLDG